jgi:hypothetical protein
MLAAALLLATAFEPPAPSGWPQPLFDTFRQVCVEGGGQLPVGTRPARFTDLPVGARKALQMLHPAYSRDSAGRFRSALMGGQAIAQNAVPNAIYRIEGRSRAWLLAPAPNAPAGTIGSQCVVIWGGRDYDAAAGALHQALGFQRGTFPAAIMPQNLGWADASFGGNWAVAASLGDWTFLSSLPAADAPATSTP